MKKAVSSTAPLRASSTPVSLTVCASPRLSGADPLDASDHLACAVLLVCADHHLACAALLLDDAALPTFDHP